LINAVLEGISPVGWGAMGGDTANMRYWEYNSRNLADGKPVDVSQRKSESKQLTMEKDSGAIANYSSLTYVLGWTPAMEPRILAQPQAVTVAAGQPATFDVKVVAVPKASYQWFKSGARIQGATEPTLRLVNVKTDDAARYTVTAANASGRVTSIAAPLTVK
jgi:hypothetical protein